MQALSSYFSEFYIRLEEPEREYFPGEIVRGTIIVQSSKTIKSSAVRFKFKGKVTSKSRDRDFNLFEKEVPVTEHSQVEKYLNFSFSLNIPNDIPSSCMFSGYAITYTLKATLQMVSWFSALTPKDSKVIKILDDINIKKFPPPTVRPFQIEVKGKKKTRGYAHINIDISKGAIMRGQTVPIRIHIKHIVPIKNLEGVLIALYKRTEIISKDGKQEIARKVVASTISPILIDPSTLESIINTKMTVPNEIPPTINNARSFFVSYSIEINVDLTIKKTIYESSNKIGKLNYNHLRKKLGKYSGCFSIPIVIGTTDNGEYCGDYDDHPRHHTRRSSEWTIGSTNTPVDPIDPTYLSALSISPDSYRGHHYKNGDSGNSAISWDEAISHAPSAPSIDEFEYDIDRAYYSS